MHQAVIRRNVRIMAFAAVDLAAGEGEMFCFEVAVITVMAVQALVRNGLRQQAGEGTRVWQVAAETFAVTGGRVSGAIVQSLGQVGVAGQAEPSRLVQQQVLDFARVRLVAAGTLTVGNWLVAADSRGQVAADLMAVGAEGIEPVDQKARVVGGVMLVATVTGLLFKWRVHDRVVFLHE